MKPPVYRYLLAHTASTSVGIGIVGALGFVVTPLQWGGVLMPRGVADAMRLALVLLPVAAIGWILGMWFLWPMVGHAVARIQGWPFIVGEQVWILSGQHKDTRATVYEVWSERGQVRLELGPEAKERVEDVYCAVALCRAPNNSVDGACQ